MAQINRIHLSNNKDKTVLKKIKDIFMKNIVTIIFLVLCLIGIELSGLPIFFVVSELVTRLTRNSFLVLSLIIPVLAGMGLNFSIVIGAMAGQIAIIAVTHWGVTGIWGFLLCVVLSFPFALFFGYLTGKLLNKTKGQEMIASMILGFFANGLYQLTFLFLVGTVIPMKNDVLILSHGVGVRNTIDLSGGLESTGIKYALDEIWKFPIFYIIIILCGLVLLYFGIKLAVDIIKYRRGNKKPFMNNCVKYIFNITVCLILLVVSILIMTGDSSLSMINLPMITAFVIVILCLFNTLIVKTKLGQDFRTVGQDKHIAKVSGINVDKVRVLAIIISTVLAAWGQLIFLQNIGTLNTYGSHEQIGMFSIAALLIGGASVSKATVGQAILGTVLFHTLFIVSPLAGRNLFGDAQIGEFFRAFVVYGVIGISLGLHAWRKRVELKNKLRT